MAIQNVLVPDIGNFDSVDVIEVLVKAGDSIEKDDSLMTVESDKASMDIPAPFAGVVKEVNIKVGDKAAQGTLILSLEVTEEAAKPAETAKVEAPKAEPAKADVVTEKVADIPAPTRPAPEPPKPIAPAAQPAPVGASAVVASGKLSHASPSVRKFARELGVNLSLVQGSGNKNRILEADVQAYVKASSRNHAQIIWARV